MTPLNISLDGTHQANQERFVAWLMAFADKRYREAERLHRYRRACFRLAQKVLELKEQLKTVGACDD